MRPTRLFIFAAVIILSNAALSFGQVVIQINPNAAQQPDQLSRGDDDELIRAIFDPITDDLNLTPAQKLRVVAIATDTMTKADPLFDQLDDLEAQLSLAAFSGQLDEDKIRKVAAQEAALLNEVIALKARAKLSFAKVLNDEQRAMIVSQYRRRASENLGSISNLYQ